MLLPVPSYYWPAAAAASAVVAAEDRLPRGSAEIIAGCRTYDLRGPDHSDRELGARRE